MKYDDYNFWAQLQNTVKYVNKRRRLYMYIHVYNCTQWSKTRALQNTVIVTYISIGTVV